MYVTLNMNIKITYIQKKVECRVKVECDIRIQKENFKKVKLFWLHIIITLMQRMLAHNICFREIRINEFNCSSQFKRKVEKVKWKYIIYVVGCIFYIFTLFYKNIICKSLMITEVVSDILWTILLNCKKIKKIYDRI